MNTTRGVIAPIVFDFEDTDICPVRDRLCTPVNWDPLTDTLFQCLRP